MKARACARAAAVLLTLTLLAACSGTQSLQVDDAQIRELLPGRDTTAGYFSLFNNSGRTVTLTGARSAHARAIEMHKTTISGDSVGMQRVKQQTLQQGERVQFAPGGLHLMIFGVTDTPEPFPITLLFADGEQLEVSFSKLTN